MNGRQRWVELPPKSLRYENTHLYHGDLAVSEDVLERGYDLLDTFDAVLIRKGPRELHARQVAQGEDYARCLADLPTLWVPLFRADAVWLTRNETTDRLLELWREGTDDWSLALLRAVYLATPTFYLLLPSQGEEVVEEYEGLTVRASRYENDWTAGVFDGEALLWRSRDNEFDTAEAGLAKGRGGVDSA